MNPDDAKFDPRGPDDDAIDRELRAAFAPPPSHQLAAVAERAMDGARAMPRPWWPWLLAAAAVIACALLAWPRRDASLGPLGPEGHDGAQLGRMFAAAYEHAVTRGGNAATDATPACCGESHDFCKDCEQRFAVRLALRADCPFGLSGCCCGSPTGGCVATLLDSEHGPVAVFVLPRERDPKPRLPASSELQLSRRELAGLVLYGVGRGPADAQPLDQFIAQP